MKLVDAGLESTLAICGSMPLRSEPFAPWPFFEEDEIGRTQEFVLRWSSDGGRTLREIVRQQWNFSPPESIREVEQYQVDLHNVEVLELVIKPEIGGGLARASLRNFRLA